ncbi:MAG TPA: SDR family NAD(P)-dependent oxidoreductase [Ktedonobacteraceae bacterium]|jgi:NAD(P)-dependent dehydrogenase (short-subunit alcohol dehydrogenase family)|nr:SDR family NAD(P)-dependent oxidoreductase [Ktedonobacteraceae bacterium]
MSQSSFGARSTASEVIAGHDLREKTILITGASAGIGYETVRALLSAHAEVIIAGRDRVRGEQAVQALQTEYPESPVHFLPLDLGLLASVRQTAEQFFARWNRLDVLINNAAIAAVPLGYTPDGFEQQFATNFLGHFFLAQLLLPALCKAAPARVISLTSGTHRASDIHFDDIQYRHRPYEKWEAYGQSKTADALLAVALTRHFREQGITANAVNPGGVLSGLQRYLTDEERRTRYYDEAGNLNPVFKTPEQGASTTVWASVAAELAGIGGLYLEDCQQGIPYNPEVSTLSGYMPYALNAEHAEQLWTLAGELVGL